MNFLKFDFSSSGYAARPYGFYGGYGYGAYATPYLGYAGYGYGRYY
jgi:hypothetical protein